MSSAATKRDAKAYLSRLRAAPPSSTTKARQDETSLVPEKHIARPEVNLGAFFGHARAVERSPKFSLDRKHDHNAITEKQQAHHLALVKLAGLQYLDDTALQGLGLTLAQLSRLGMTPCVVLDCGSGIGELGQAAWRQKMTSQAGRLERAIRSSSGVEARVSDNVFVLSKARSLPHTLSRRLLISPIKSGQIPVILPLAYSEDTQAITQISADQAVLALTREFAGLNVQPLPDEDPKEIRQRVNALQKETSVDRLIILDPQGGIPRPAAPGSCHVFLNLEQEFHDVREELLAYTDDTGSARSLAPTKGPFSPSMTGSNPVSLQLDREESAQSVLDTKHPPRQKGATQSLSPSFGRHLANLDLLRDVLAFLPPTSSAIVTTPIDAARSSKTSDQDTSISAVATRTQKNPLIHNLLTDKPPHSASLPRGRLGPSSDPGMVPFGVSTPTFVKRGMPLTIIPDPRKIAWTAKNHQEPQLKLTDPRIDLSRLVHLINDSFNRKLDVEHYLDRVNDRIAGVIIAGEYEGGAILTWETPPGVPSSDVLRRVPYLDKFAVLKRSQGAGGVADVVFNVMVRGCFPNGVCWRSRRDNPVNKWYFERARGTWKLPGTNWTMFWTTEGVEAGVGQIFTDYEAVCRGVEPSWADNKVVD